MSAVSFLISLEDKISPSAGAAATSLASLDAQLKKDSASLKTMESALKRLQSTEGASQERIDSLTAAIDGKKAAIGETTNQIADYSAANDNAGDSTGLLSDKIAAMGGPWGIAAAAAAALATAVLAIGAALVSTALASASAYRNQNLLNTAMSGSAEVGQAMTEATYRVSREVALSGDKVQQLAGSLSKAGLSGKVFETSLKNLASVASVAGEEAVGPLKEIVEKSQQLGHLKLEPDQLKGTGLNAKEVYAKLASDLGIGISEVEQRIKDGKVSADVGLSALNSVMADRFGELSSAKALDFDSQLSKARENFGAMFRDVRIEPFLEGLRSVLSLLDETTPTGAAMKSVLTGAMDSFFAAAAAVLPYVKEFILQLGIAGLRLYIALKPAISALGELFGGGSENGSEVAMKAIAVTAQVIVGTIAAAILVVGAVVGAIGYAVYSVGAAFVAVGSYIVGAWSAVGDAVTGAFDALSSLDLGQVASDLIDGLVQGIASGTGLVVQAISGLGGSAVAALKATLGIASPSKVFAGLGNWTAEGFAGGVDKGAAMVEDSVTAMVEMPTIAPPTIGTPEVGPVSGGGSFTVAEGAIVIHIHGSQDPKSTGVAVKEALGEFFAEFAESKGLAAA